MKKKDLNNLAMQIVRSDGTNNWTKLVNACNLMNIKLCPIYTSSKYYHKCEFYLDNYRFPECGAGKTIRDSNEDVVQKFLNLYTDITQICASNKLVNEHDAVIIVDNTVKEKKGIQQMLAGLARLVQQKKHLKILDIIVNQCQRLNVSLDKLESGINDPFSCTLVLNGNCCPVIGNGPTREVAFRWAVENFLVKFFSTKIYNMIHIVRMFHDIAKCCLSSPFSTPWKTFCNAGKLLGRPVSRQLTETGPGQFVCSITVNGALSDCLGIGANHDGAANHAAILFVLKYRDLQVLERETLAQYSDQLDHFTYLATSCMDEFWSDNWHCLSEVCSEHHIALARHQNRVPGTNKFQCSMIIGQYDYSHIVELSDLNLGHNLLVQHLLLNYGREEILSIDKEVSPEICLATAASPQVNEDQIIFERISELIQLNATKNAWKALCNASLSLNVEMKHKFVEKNDQFYCECTLDGKFLDMIGQGKTRKEAGTNLAHQFIKKFDKSKSLKTNPVSSGVQSELDSTGDESTSQMSLLCNDSGDDQSSAIPTEEYKGVYFLNY